MKEEYVQSIYPILSWKICSIFGKTPLFPHREFEELQRNLTSAESITPNIQRFFPAHLHDSQVLGITKIEDDIVLDLNDDGVNCFYDTVQTFFKLTKPNGRLTLPAKLKFVGISRCDLYGVSNQGMISKVDTEFYIKMLSEHQFDEVVDIANDKIRVGFLFLSDTAADFPYFILDIEAARLSIDELLIDAFGELA